MITALSGIAALLRRLWAGPAQVTASMLSAAVDDELGRAPDTDEHRPLLRGLRDGLAAPAAPLLWPDALPDDDSGPDLAYRAAVLSGRILSSRLDGASDEASALRAVAYASALATPQAQRPLSAGDLVRAHTYACLLTERRAGDLSEEEEDRLSRWLWAGAGRTLTGDESATLERLRHRRRGR